MLRASSGRASRAFVHIFEERAKARSWKEQSFSSDKHNDVCDYRAVQTGERSTGTRTAFIEVSVGSSSGPAEVYAILRRASDDCLSMR